MGRSSTTLKRCFVSLKSSPETTQFDIPSKRMAEPFAALTLEYVGKIKSASFFGITLMSAPESISAVTLCELMRSFILGLMSLEERMRCISAMSVFSSKNCWRASIFSWNRVFEAFPDSSIRFPRTYNLHHIPGLSSCWSVLPKC